MHTTRTTPRSRKTQTPDNGHSVCSRKRKAVTKKTKTQHHKHQRHKLGTCEQTAETRHLVQRSEARSACHERSPKRLPWFSTPLSDVLIHACSLREVGTRCYGAGRVRPGSVRVRVGGARGAGLSDVLTHACSLWEVGTRCYGAGRVRPGSVGVRVGGARGAGLVGCVFGRLCIRSVAYSVGCVFGRLCIRLFAYSSVPHWIAVTGRESSSATRMAIVNSGARAAWRGAVRV